MMQELKNKSSWKSCLHWQLGISTINKDFLTPFRKYWQDSTVEGHVLIFSCKNIKIATSCWTTIDRRMLVPTEKDTPHPRTKEKLRQDGRRGTIMLLSNPIPARDSWRAQTKPYVHQDPEKGALIHTRNWARPACECLSFSYGGVGQQWPATGTGVLAAAVLGGTTCGIRPLGGGHHEPYHRATRWVNLKLENNYTKEALIPLWRF